jgi:hypothetical protein
MLGMGAALGGIAVPAGGAHGSGAAAAEGAAPPPRVTLLTAPIELAGDWGRMLPRAAEAVVERMRVACLDGVALVSDRQPSRLRVEERSSGPPAIWLHRDGSSVAWVIVDIGERDWSRLAYQFGHELGHVLANSWQPDAAPAPPCQWLEEAMVEALSLFGLARLAAGWRKSPPFAGDNAFGDAIAGYRDDILKRYAALAAEQALAGDPGAWLAAHRAGIEAGTLVPYGQAMSLTVLAEYERAPGTIAALGALNRWPGRSRLKLADYFSAWQASCAALGAPPHLPLRLRELLRAA